MSISSQHPLRCPLVGSRVIISRQVLRGICGIGDVAIGVQIEHGCSAEALCPHRYLPQCPVRRLDALS